MRMRPRQDVKTTLGHAQGCTVSQWQVKEEDPSYLDSQPCVHITTLPIPVLRKEIKVLLFRSYSFLLLQGLGLGALDQEPTV